jgi:uncharacterized protein
MRHQWMVFTAMIALWLLFPLPTAGGESRAPASSAVTGENAPTGGGFIPAAVDLFRRHISPIDGDRCPMYPSCSQYSLDAVHEHGLIMGWVMTCDRLLRCGRDELSTSPRIVADEGWRCYDPVENNDFWRTR